VGDWFNKLGNDIEDGWNQAVAAAEKALNDLLEAMMSIWNEVKNQILRGLDGIINLGDMLKRKIVDPINNILNNFKALVFQPLENGVSNVTSVFTNEITKITTRMDNLNNGFINIFAGINKGFIGLGTGLNIGFRNIGDLFRYTGEYTTTHVSCSVKMIGNMFNECLVFYCADIACQIMYFPIRIVLNLYSIFVYKNIYKVEDRIYKYAIKLDKILYGVSGWRIMRWPKNIRDKCYNCKRLKRAVLTSKASDVKVAFDTTLPNLLDDATKSFSTGKQLFNDAFA